MSTAMMTVDGSPPGRLMKHGCPRYVAADATDKAMVAAAAMITIIFRAPPLRMQNTSNAASNGTPTNNPGKNISSPSFLISVHNKTVWINIA